MLLVWRLMNSATVWSSVDFYFSLCFIIKIINRWNRPDSCKGLVVVPLYESSQRYFFLNFFIFYKSLTFKVKTISFWASDEERSEFQIKECLHHDCAGAEHVRFKIGLHTWMHHHRNTACQHWNERHGIMFFFFFSFLRGQLRIKSLHETHLRNVGAYGDRCCECLFSNICQVLMLKASRNMSGLKWVTADCVAQFSSNITFFPALNAQLVCFFYYHLTCSTFSFYVLVTFLPWNQLIRENGENRQDWGRAVEFMLSRLCQDLCTWFLAVQTVEVWL